MSLSTLPGIAAYFESRFLAFAKRVTHLTSEKILSKIGTFNTLSMVLLKVILLLQTSEVSQKDESIRKEELAEILRGLTDNRPVAGVSRSWTSDVNQAMEVAEEQVAPEAEEKASKEAGIVAAAAVVAEAVCEEKDIDSLLAKRRARGGKLLKDQAGLSIFEQNVAKRVRSQAALGMAVTDDVASSERSFVFPTREGKSQSIRPYDTQLFS